VIGVDKLEFVSLKVFRQSFPSTPTRLRSIKPERAESLVDMSSAATMRLPGVSEPEGGNSSSSSYSTSR